MAASPAQAGIGTPVSRIDGPAKVTGAARYAADHPIEGLLYGVAVSSTIARGRIAALDDSAALAVPGVVTVIHHENRAHLPWRTSRYGDQLAPAGGKPLRPFYDDTIYYNGQPVALVVAETFEAARHAARLIAIDYEGERHNTDLDVAIAERFVPRQKPPSDRGDTDAALETAPVRHEGEYRLATEHHNPMELHGATVEWHGEGRLTVHDKTQGPAQVQDYLCNVFGFEPDDVRVLNPYVGGAFGAALRPLYHVFLATLAAKMLERSVRVVLTRQQMFTHVHRPEAIQRVALGAEADGKLTAISTIATTATSRYEAYAETIVEWGGQTYAAPNAHFDYAVAPIDSATPGSMRGPGAATGLTLFEMAMDELAYAADVDPLALRLTNYSDIEQIRQIPYTSKALKACYEQGAEAFGWDQRSQAPRSMREGRELIGWGMATGVWDAMFMKTSARARLGANGHLEVASATSDIGTGTYTIMAQIAAGVLGLPVEQVSAKLGDSSLPPAPLEGGSWGAASTGAAVQLACEALQAKLAEAAGKLEGRPFGSQPEIASVGFADGEMYLKADPQVRAPYGRIMAAAGVTELEAEATAAPGPRGMANQVVKARNTHSAVFAEVRVDEELGVVRITRIVSAIAAGRIINPKTARSQIVGGVVWGIGMALHEETMTDHHFGRIMNHSLAEYHIPAHADVDTIDVIFVEEQDSEVSPLGVKGVGEIGTVSTAAAIANAIFHATGKRVRELPITIDKLL
ncbi:xanthine dehydrogenase family protein molybdopterin-binding subunit [Sphingomonas naphthae]|uniref:Xanthine dehydrogenase family protein molybdopterin-binding subunit n=1 Tax=Sphingomonas naphthae TaxID=1813468 RepID=A0ABY7TKN6_9SPHN|nr:xanthine dehydrogenase family protein molybdopterin-binding subunit [Sphingomonas naphthae]WCT73802.1 xanthine dehydrogenase family protein molybdopterin-binding subunit [Sphingomonas naphthae]